MIIVSGTFEVDPAQREAFLAGRLDRMRTSRAEAGCLGYVPMENAVAPSSASIGVYDVTGERPLR